MLLPGLQGQGFARVGAMNALHRLWQALAARLPAEDVAELQTQYKRDAAIDNRASRERTKQRHAKLKVEREKKKQGRAVPATPEQDHLIG